LHFAIGIASQLTRNRSIQQHLLDDFSLAIKYVERWLVVPVHADANTGLARGVGNFKHGIAVTVGQPDARDAFACLDVSGLVGQAKMFFISDFPCDSTNATA